MSKLSFRQKLWLPLAFSLIALTLLSVFYAYQARGIRIEERKNNLVSVTSMALNLVKQYDDLVRGGLLTKEEAQKQALERFRALRYDKDGYFTITRSDNVVVMHPIKPEFIGKDQSGFKDAQGNSVYVNLTGAARQPNGGFTSYVWPHVGGTELVPKTAYALRYEPWDWVFSTGAYMDDINAAFMTSLYESGGLLLLAGTVLVLLAGVANRGLQRTLGGDPAYAAEVANRIAGGDLSVEIATGRTTATACSTPWAACAVRWCRPSAASGAHRRPSARRPARSPAGTWTCPRAPSSRQARSKRPPRPWKS